MSTTVSQRDMQSLMRLFDKVERVTKKEASGLIRQASIFAGESAAKLMPPGKTSKISKLPAKYRFRQLVRLPDNEGIFYEDRDKPGVIFQVPDVISRKNVQRNNLRRVTKGIKVWSKARGTWVYWPYEGNRRDTSDPRFKIPNAGAAKAGFLQAVKRLDSKAKDMGGLDAQVLGRADVTRYSITIVNLVEYSAKIGHDVPQQAILKTIARMKAIWQPKVDKAIQRLDK